MMSCEQVRNRLDDHLDGALPPAVRSSVEEHLDGCPGCRRELGELRSLAAAARELAPEVPPDRDLWPEIEARLAPRRRGRLIPFPVLDRATWIAWAAVAAAVAIAVGLALWSPGRPSGGPGSPPPAAVTEAVPAATETADLAAGIRQVQRDLRRVIDRRGDHLSPQALAVVQANVEIIDQAIAEILTALDQEPGNRELHLLLATQYHHEVELLNQLSRL